jgi:uncharacterized protein
VIGAVAGSAWCGVASWDGVWWDVSPTAWAAAVVVGLSLGLLGSGGSILTVPLLHVLVGVPFPEARATSFPVVGGVALGALVAHARAGAVRLAAAAPFVAASLPCSFAAARWLAPLVPTRAQVVAFAALMLLAAWRMARRAPGDVPRERRPLPAVVAFGAGVGALTGLLGVGGGFLIVPALVLGLRFDVRSAIGTSLLVIALNCAAGLAAVVAAGEGRAVQVDLALVFVLAGLAGVLLGARLGTRLSPVALRRTFATVVLVVAGVLLAVTFR